MIATGLSGERADAADRPFLSDLNLFWDVSGAPVALGDGHGAGKGGLRKAYDLAGWQALGLDRHSLAADPRFVGPRAPRPAPRPGLAGPRASASGRSTSRTSVPARAGSA